MRDDVVKAAMELCERNGIEATVKNIARNLLINPMEYSRIFQAGAEREVSASMRRLGCVTSEVNRKTKAATKVLPRKITLKVLIEYHEAQKKNLGYVRARSDAISALIQFLKARKAELGYEPYVQLFAEDARRIFAMHGLELPRGWDADV